MLSNDFFTHFTVSWFFAYNATGEKWVIFANEKLHFYQTATSVG
jgi:hypothetical protein